MKKMRFAGVLAAIFSCAVFVPVVDAAGDSEAGKKKFYTCEGCHGVVGYTNAYPTYNVPRLGGQHADYVVAALKSYQDGQRKHPSMQGNAISLSEQDMQDIAAYVAKFRPVNANLPSTGNIATGREKAMACGGCHGEDGNSTDPNFPRLAGQYESYLVKALREYKSGVRNSPMMGGFASALSDEDMNDIAAYYATQKKGLAVTD